MVWVPNPGPQTDAYLSEADILLYGGQAGGGKSTSSSAGASTKPTPGSSSGASSQTDGLEKDGKKIIGIATPAGTARTTSGRWPMGAR
jgi:hypothetical protein